MALIKCHECGVSISNAAKNCPNCGAPRRKTYGVGTAIILIILGILVYSYSSQEYAKYNRKMKDSAGELPPKTTAGITTDREAEPERLWEFRESTDEMSGEKSRSVAGYSRNHLEGWLRSGKIYFSYNCSDRFTAIALDIGFARHDTICNKGRECQTIQFTRVKFDSGKPRTVYFEVPRGDNEVLVMNNVQGYPEVDNLEFMRNGMMTAKTLHFEVELFNTKINQIAEFDLTGFAEAARKCQP